MNKSLPLRPVLHFTASVHMPHVGIMVGQLDESMKFYGMHRHFTDAGSVLMFGGGMKRGFVYGQTADERPCKIVKDPVVIDDLHASIYRAVGIPPQLAYDIERRPFYVTNNGKGKPIMDLFG